MSLFRRLLSWRRHFARVDLTASRLATLVGDPVTLRSVARRLHLQFGPDRSGIVKELSRESTAQAHVVRCLAVVVHLFPCERSIGSQ